MAKTRLNNLAAKVAGEIKKEGGKQMPTRKQMRAGIKGTALAFTARKAKIIRNIAEGAGLTVKSSGTTVANRKIVITSGKFREQ